MTTPVGQTGSNPPGPRRLAHLEGPLNMVLQLIAGIAGLDELGKGKSEKTVKTTWDPDSGIQVTETTSREEFKPGDIKAFLSDGALATKIIAGFEQFLEAVEKARAASGGSESETVIEMGDDGAAKDKDTTTTESESTGVVPFIGELLGGGRKKRAVGPDATLIALATTLGTTPNTLRAALGRFVQDEEKKNNTELAAIRGRCKTLDTAEIIAAAKEYLTEINKSRGDDQKETTLGDLIQTHAKGDFDLFVDLVAHFKTDSDGKKDDTLIVELIRRDYADKLRQLKPYLGMFVEGAIGDEAIGTIIQRLAQAAWATPGESAGEKPIIESPFAEVILKTIPAESFKDLRTLVNITKGLGNERIGALVREAIKGLDEGATKPPASI